MDRAAVGAPVMIGRPRGGSLHVFEFPTGVWPTRAKPRLASSRSTRLGSRLRPDECATRSIAIVWTTRRRY